MCANSGKWFQENIIRLGFVEFTPKWIPTIATVVVVVVTANLGQWQLNRAKEKRDLQQQYELMQTKSEISLQGSEAKDLNHLQFGKLEARGRFNPQGQIFLDNQVENNQAGYHVLTPLLLADGRHYILVNRGWTPRVASYPAPPKVDVSQKEITVKGYGLLPVKRFFELSANTIQDSVWQNITFDRYKQSTGLDVLPIILVQTQNNTDGLIPFLQKPEFGIEKHQGYAFQWFAMSLSAVLFYLFVNVRFIKDS